MTPLRVLVVDDEPLARARLLELLDDCNSAAAQSRDSVAAGVQGVKDVQGVQGVSIAQVGQAAHAQEALAQLRAQPWDVLLLDIHMPGVSGLALAQSLRTPLSTSTPSSSPQSQPPALIFVTAHAEHALAAFELEALDYLTKPVRLARLQTALQKVARARPAQAMAQPRVDAPEPAVLHIQERHRIERVPLQEVLYLKAELKYLTVRTAQRSYLLDGALSALEARYGDYFVRIHRNALVAAHALRTLDKLPLPPASATPNQPLHTWAVQLAGLEGDDAWLPVSRRHLAALRERLAQRV